MHTVYLLFRLFIRSRLSIKLWFFLCLPQLIIEFWFERIARPAYKADGDLQRAGEDLEAKGLTEWMWDITYWTWGNVVFAAVLGNWAWWAWMIVPLYSAWLAFTTFTGAKQGLAGMGGAGGEGGASSGGQGGQSKRQAKMEKRGGQKVQYR